VVEELDVRPALAAVDGEAAVLSDAVLDRVLANEVRHGVTARRAEGNLGGLGGLEEDVRVAVAVQLGGRVARGADVVAALLVHLGDRLDAAGPRGLRREHLRLGHVASDRRGRRGRRVRHRRVVQEDAHLAVEALLVAERVLDLGLVARGGAREVVVTHRDGRVAVHIDVVVVENDRLPALAAVDGEAAVLLVAARDRVAAHEVRHRVARHGAELVLGRLGGLEEHVRVAVRVELARGLARGADVVAALKVRLRDRRDRVRPRVLRRAHLLLGDKLRLGRRGDDNTLHGGDGGRRRDLVLDHPEDHLGRRGAHVAHARGRLHHEGSDCDEGREHG